MQSQPIFDPIRDRDADCDEDLKHPRDATSDFFGREFGYVFVEWGGGGGLVDERQKRKENLQRGQIAGEEMRGLEVM